MSAERSAGRRALAILLAAAAVAGLALLVWRAQTPPAGPVEPAWDRTACARCRMLVSDPAFAAQIHTPAGAVLHFDDPGCALLHAADRPADVHALWFHHLTGDRWLPGDAAAFRPVSPTPMGYGLGAVAPGGEGTLSPEEALARVRARDAARGGGP